MGRLAFRHTSSFKLLAAALLVAGLGGCGSSSTSSSSSSPRYGAAPSASSTSATSASTTAGSSAATPAPTGAAQVLKLAADPSGALSYNTTTLTAHPGKVTIEFANMAPLSHNVSVASTAGATLGATPTFSGGTRAFTLNLKAGTYTFFCSVPGHRQAGMQGTLTVG